VKSCSSCWIIDSSHRASPDGPDYDPKSSSTARLAGHRLATVVELSDIVWVCSSGSGIGTAAKNGVTRVVRFSSHVVHKLVP